MRAVKKFRSVHSLPLLLGLAVSIGLCAPAFAQTLDPFQMETGHWMSFDHYSDNVKHNRPVGDEAIKPPPAPETDSVNATPAESAPAPAAQTSSAAPAIAAPTRPIELPVLPGVNKDFSIQVDSTLDNDATTPARIIEKEDGQSDLHLQEQNWQDAAEVARAHANEKYGVAPDTDRTPLDVRLSFLPNSKIAPVFGDAPKARPRLTELPMTARTPPKRTMTPEVQKTPAECSAIDAYKKKQLEAIQSDRKTLQALQSAISDLGLQKQLDFIGGAQQSPTLGQATPVPTTAAP